jgi:hypothetical protein
MDLRRRIGRRPDPTLPESPLPTSFYPRNKIGVIAVAEKWYDPRRVKINEDAIARLAPGEIKLHPEATNLELNQAVSLRDACQYGLAMNSINYRFWDKAEDGAFIRYQQEGRIGAVAMTHAFQQAWNDPSSPIARARDAKIPLKVADIQAVFGDMPDPESRVAILNEVLLSPKLGAIADRAVALAHDPRGVFDTVLAAEVADAFPRAYADGVLKKAQLAVSGLWREAVSRQLPSACDLTAMADYQIPNVLRHMGILEYAPELGARIDGMELIPVNGPDEEAIRGASILAVEALARAQGVTVADVDYWVWSKRKEPATPFHLTVTDAY